MAGCIRLKAITAIRAWATRGASVAEDVACKGTALESTTFKVGGKAFLFVQAKAGLYVVRLKLKDSIAKAKRSGHEVGNSGWVKITLASEELPAELATWVRESRDLVATPSKRAKPEKKATASKDVPTRRPRASPMRS